MRTQGPVDIIQQLMLHVKSRYVMWTVFTLVSQALMLFLKSSSGRVRGVIDGCLRQLMVPFSLSTGDLVTFDNWRLLHGRKEYQSDATQRRHLEGAYLDWDEVMSRLRILRKAVHGDN